MDDSEKHDHMNVMIRHGEPIILIDGAAVNTADGLIQLMLLKSDDKWAIASDGDEPKAVHEIVSNTCMARYVMTADSFGRIAETLYNHYKKHIARNDEGGE